ncbi:HpcH/HpaI aldolase/citrate lyase family protein [Desulfovirgula thermocuniculi]|uniref:HpcH/HpaI aldolase/citrate lyase family protein n=1 Tax=Desulfovirgula thermocuniculi TaxID=348842 RepID=UPI000416FD03|nr:CoA ester lyase [Desulfovirgula thermocuniculi]
MFLLRTLLFVPAVDRRKAEKAFTTEADAVIFDLEDAVAENQKDAARRAVREMLAALSPTRPVFVRVNGPQSPHILRDLEAVVDLPLEGLMVAKAECGEDVARVDWLLSLLEKERGLPMGRLALIPFVESARGIAKAQEIAAAPRVACLAFGGNDYLADLGVAYSPEGEEMAHARCQLVVASRAAGIAPPLDTVNPDFKNIPALVDDARRARRLGFGGKLVIHPAQVAPVNEVFTPTREEIAWAREAVEAFARAQAAGSAVIQVKGKMVELPIARRAEQVLAAARRLGLLEE